MAIIYTKISFLSKIYLSKKFLTKLTAKSLKYLIQFMNKDIQNYAPTVMFPGTPCISQQKKSMEESITSLSSY